MHQLYELATGPLVWVAVIIFLGGSIYRIGSMALLAKKKDPMVYAYMSPFFALRSIVHWIIPFMSVNSRQQPVMTIVTFLFHICLIITPLFVSAHVILFKEAWNVSWWYLPDHTADIMAFIVVGGCIYFAGRRLLLPEVKYLTSASDFALLALVATPFVTGIWAYHQLAGAEVMLLVHILSGELLLALIPFTRLSHALFFPLTRGYIGSEFGAVRHARDW